MYIVTGGAGFIGSNLVAGLNARGISDILVVDDLTDGEKFRNIRDLQLEDYLDKSDFIDEVQLEKFPFSRVDAVLHQGACTNTMEYDGRYMMATNYQYSKVLFQYATHHHIPFIYASSAAVYGASSSFAEDPENERPVNVYGYSKLLFDRYVIRHLPSVVSPVVGLRYFNVYGPQECHKGRMASTIFQFYKQLKDSGVIRLFEGTDGYADGGQSRDFVYVGDVAKVNLFFLEKSLQGIFNVGTGHSRTFNDVAHCLINHYGTGTIEYLPFPDTLQGKYQSYTQADLVSLRNAGYRDGFVSLEQGIAQYCAWMDK